MRGRFAATLATVSLLGGVIACSEAGSGGGSAGTESTVPCSDAGTCPNGLLCRSGRCISLQGSGGSGGSGGTSGTSCTYTCATGEQHSCSGPCADTCACAATCGESCDCVRSCFR
jgi:hypothetical protein